MTDPPEHAAVFEHIAEVDDLVFVKFEVHHVAVWSIGEHEGDRNGTWGAKVHGVHVPATMAANAMVVARSFWLRGQDVMAFVLVAGRAHGDVLYDVVILIEVVNELNLILHEPAPVPACLNPSEYVPAREA